MDVETNKIRLITEAICAVTATRLGKASVTWEEVEQVYADGSHPEINAEINYILNG